MLHDVDELAGILADQRLSEQGSHGRRLGSRIGLQPDGTGLDGCPLREARRLNDIARGEGSELRVITVGADGVDFDEDCVMIRPTPADRSTIRSILKAGLPRKNSRRRKMG